jgi:hypothetical protein
VGRNAIAVRSSVVVSTSVASDQGGVVGSSVGSAVVSLLRLQNLHKVSWRSALHKPTRAAHPARGADGFTRRLTGPAFVSLLSGGSNLG